MRCPVEPHNMHLLFVSFAFLVAQTAALLQCHPETLTYNYENEIKLWGSVEQSYHVTCTVDIDCIGVSQLSSPESPAFEFVAHIYNVVVKEDSVRPENVKKLCQSSSTTPGAECTVGEPGEAGDAKVNVARDDGLFSLPVRFAQTPHGRILRLDFMEKDFENADVLNMKKGIISTFQTRISGREEKDVTEEETDVTGTHDAHYSAEMTAGGTMVRKKYSTNDESKKHSFTKQTESRVYMEALVANGEFVESKGETSSHMPDDKDSEDDIDPSDLKIDVDVGQILSSRSQFDMKLKLKTKRSVSRKKRLAEYKSFEFLSSSLAMDMSDKTEPKYEQLEFLYGQLKTISLEEVIGNFLMSKDEDDLKIVKKIIMLETELGFEQIRRKMSKEGKPLVDILVSSTYGLMSDCDASWDTCREILELYSLGGGRRAEEVFEFMLSGESNETEDQQLDVINLASFMVNPSDNFVLELVDLLEKENPESDKFSSFLLGLGTLAGRQTVTETTKQIVSALLFKELEDIVPGHCPEDVSHADALEAIGNMEDRRFMDRLIEINAACGNSTVMRVALLHAMRGFLEDDRAQGLMIDTLFVFECEVSQNMLNLLSEILQDQQLQEHEHWPWSGFNGFDETLRTLLLGTGNLECLHKDAINYYKEKISNDAQQLVKLLKFGGQSTNNATSEVTKRAIKQHSSCSYWGDSRYDNIQSAMSFWSDRNTYNYRQHCLGHFRLGASKATADIYAGYFAGYRSPSSSDRRKLFAKAVAIGKIFSKRFSIGTVLLYFQTNGQRTPPSGRIYARIAGKTLVDKRLTMPSYWRRSVFSKSIRIPLARIPVYIIRINVDLILSAKFEVTTYLRLCNGWEICLTYTPTVSARAAASVSTSLGLVRGGVDLVVNLNYYVEGEARVRLPQPCIRLSHGANRNTISLEFWYQIRSKFRVKFGWWPPKFRISWKWGSKKTWTPSSLKWSIISSRKRTIFSSC